jgi:CubicO group peptidase (beta-lactamase class C family)
LTYGWLIGEVVRRATGKSIGAFVRENIATPLEADLYIGLPESCDARVADMLKPKRTVDMSSLPLSDAARMAVGNPVPDAESPNTRAWRGAEIPAANGQASAMGLAKLYAALVGGGTLDGAKLLSRETVVRMTTPVTSNGRKDMFLQFVDSWGMGVAINTPGIYGPNPRAYGHSGWGGSFGCADPDAGIAIGYVCNQMGPNLVGDPRTEGLCKAVLESAISSN